MYDTLCNKNHILYYYSSFQYVLNQNSRNFALIHPNNILPCILSLPEINKKTSEIHLILDSDVITGAVRRDALYECVCKFRFF